MSLASGARSILGLLQDDKPVPGDWVLIHVGFAMSKISEHDALDQMNTLRMLGEIDGAMQEVQGYGLEEADDASTAVTWMTSRSIDGKVN